MYFRSRRIQDSLQLLEGDGTSLERLIGNVVGKTPRVEIKQDASSNDASLGPGWLVSVPK